jgi:hypothetical protein
MINIRFINVNIWYWIGDLIHQKQKSCLVQGWYCWISTLKFFSNEHLKWYLSYFFSNQHNSIAEWMCFDSMHHFYVMIWEWNFEIQSKLFLHKFFKNYSFFLYHIHYQFGFSLFERINLFEMFFSDIHWHLFWQTWFWKKLFDRWFYVQKRFEIESVWI